MIPGRLSSESGETTNVQLVSMPPANAQPGDCEESSYEVTALVGDVFMPVNSFSFRTCVVEASKLTCDSMEKLGGFAITGDLDPMTHSVPIALEFTSPSGITSLKNVNTSRKGTYQDLFIPNEIGKWKLQSFWQGDDRTAPAQSVYSEQGLLITNIDPWRPVGSSIAQVVSPTGGIDFADVTLAPGETFVDVARKITITYLSQEDGYKCKVKAERGDIHAPDRSNIQSGGEEWDRIISNISPGISGSTAR